jgi:hypothetical protein
MILIFMCCFVEIMHWNKKLFIHPWPTIHVYFCTAQQNMYFSELNFIIFN